MNITFPPELPVSERRDEIAKAISDHQVVIVAGETGSGKTTQLPKICLALGRGQDRVIGHTQPRRIAARSVADRIAEELGVELGAEVGYQVRFTDQTSAQTRVKVMTDGVLRNELQRDRDLRRYDTIIIDEAHERSLNIDFLMGYLKRLLPRRPDLKVIITSATIDPESFAAHFADRQGNPAPIVEVSGRTYPVEVRYRPLTDVDRVDEEGEVLVRDLTDAICDGVDELMSATDGDVLVFLPGEREIRDAAAALEKRTRKRSLEIVPLYSRLSAAEQHRVFASHTQRRVVLATNVAETSLTVPGITGVIDTGLARISRWSLRTKVQRLPIEPISQASARQRSGRCGRTEAGIAIRLYSEEDFEARPAFTDAEILRTSLASVILQMTALRLGDVAKFPFLDPPDQRSVRDGVALLGELGALRDGRLSGVGRRLARLPVDPRLGRMLIEADRLGCLREVIVIVAALSGQDPRERPEDKKPQSDQAHARFRDPRSDFMSWLNLWKYLQEKQGELGSSAFRRLCRDEYLNFLRVREWQDLERQLRQVAKETQMKVPRSSNTPDADSIHQAVLSGLLSHIGVLDREAAAARRQGKRLGDYLGARGARFSIFPGSGVAKARPDVVMAAELVETSALWGRQVAAIDPAWAERLGGDLVKRTWSEPHWSKRRASAQAYERVTLYGVPLVTDRLVALGGRDPQVARELFIRHALLAGEWATQHRFLARNAALLQEASELEDRARRRDIVVDEETLFDFYDARIPADVVSGAHFDSWWKQERRQHGDLLTFDPAMLVREEAVGEADAFPDVWRDGERGLELHYRFEPGHRDDGVTVDVPLGTLGGLNADQFSWQVSGLREELVTALLRGLPKALRVHVVPVPDTARAFLAEVAPGEESLTAALSRFIRARKGVFVPDDAWDLDKLPAHLLPTFRVLDAEGRVVSSGKDLDELRAPLAADFDAAVRDVASSALPRVTGATAWTFGDVPGSFRTVRAGHEIEAFPALVDEDTGVGLDVFGRRDWAVAHHRRGVRRLLALQHPRLADQLLEGLSTQQKLVLASASDPARTLIEHCVLAAIDDALPDVSGVRTAAEFESLHRSISGDLQQRSEQFVEHAIRAFTQAIEVDKAVSGRVELAALSAMADMQAQYAELMKPGFVAVAGSWLQHYPRYLSAILRRAEKLSDLHRDRLAADRVATFQNLVTEGYRALPEGQPPTADLEHGRWLVEEFRVSLWAQQLGTSEPVSERRLSKLLHGS
ncbi:MAG: ATP-dependent RNA helicase HrpA [Marmoricola sp.]